MLPNPKWPLWIAASINKHFKDNTTLLDGESIFFEGLHRSEETTNKNYIIEVRFDGPYMQQMSPTLWKLNYEINIIIQAQILDGSSNYRIYDIMGRVTEVMAEIINIYDYDINNVSPQYIDCLKRKTGKEGRDDIQAHYFGQIEPKVKRVQAVVEAHYYVELSRD